MLCSRIAKLNLDSPDHQQAVEVTKVAQPVVVLVAAVDTQDLLPPVADAKFS